MQFQNRSSSHASFLSSVLPQVHAAATPQHAVRRRIKARSVRESQHGTIAPTAPTLPSVIPPTLEVEDCDWETWLDAGGDLLMGVPG
jgi:hypothetical protein